MRKLIFFSFMLMSTTVFASQINQTSEDCTCTDTTTGKCISWTYGSTGEPICAEQNATPCESNRDCENSQFCNLVNNTGDCKNPDIGTCVKLDKGISYTYSNKTFLRSSYNLTWWAAKNWCEANGKRLVSFKSIGIKDLGTYFQKNGYCYGRGDTSTKCENVDWKRLRKAFPDISKKNEDYWVMDKFNSCYAFNMTLGTGNIDNTNLSVFHFALCE